METFYQLSDLIAAARLIKIFYQFSGLVAAGLIVWILYCYIKEQPEQFSRDNLARSFSTMGFLALSLIGFVALLVLMLRNT